ncbi:uncharacterized protein LOC131680089 [Topomyia yanbarensis]|uniref:uncharacterized protein LOC131680089 n=1 Tax=Topomyia yanbarensis TaxID=2498891 RepID=UPI00273B7C9D|nr:uncharacterized protein LOC131680089 [Topomyia yanbarensis]
MTECSSEEEVYDEEPRGSASLNTGPTRVQLAAKQVISKKLPNFSGSPEEWPMFVSSFMNANEACGFSNVAHLIRLQESLRGPALEAVRSILLLPEAVPQVMKTLQLLYVRPEQLLHTLLFKVRKAENPKLDRLNTFIQFGLVVQQLCDYLEAASLRDHLVNPMLLQELIDKLPSQTKLEWVRYKRNQKSVTLRTLSDILSQIVSEASEVTLFSEAFYQPSRIPKDNSITARFVLEGFLNAHSKVENASQDFEPHDYDQFGRGNRQKPCKICNRADHKVRYCDEFRRLPLNERLQADEGESHKIFSAHHTCELPSNQELHVLLRSHYAVEETGIAVTVLLESEEERRAREILEKTTVCTGDRFVTGLLWRQDDVAFPDSFPMALKRLKSLERKLSKDPAFEANIKQQIRENTAKGYARKLQMMSFKKSIHQNTDTIEEAMTLAKQVRYVHSKAGFTMRNWLSNEPDVLRQLGEHIHFHRDKQTEHECVIGIVWDPRDDMFMFSTELREELQPFMYGDSRPTKRAVLSIVGETEET